MSSCEYCKTDGTNLQSTNEFDYTLILYWVIA